ncbi:HEAT repeat domain-containing protein [Salinigranum sp.]|uniref:HEAT repeat domain-containing protein n=1 Tax=Salinigranum sp. TaxID=1966351 RepID=UPI003567EF42
MDDPPALPSTDRIVALLEQNARDDIVELLGRVETAPANDRKALLRSLRTVADDRTSQFAPLLPALEPFLEDEERSVRLTTAKLVARVAKARPGAAVPLVASLSDRLGDDDEFYYVRARTAEALGYVALEHPETVATPELLADLSVGLSFDEPEVREKLAKALECVALGNPRRLRHQVPKLVDHLDDENDLVRYHLYTVLVAVGTGVPERLADANDALVAGLTDETSHVRGRAAEALGLLARADHEEVTVPEAALRAMQADDDEDAFVVDRVRFALGAETPDDVGTTRGVRETTDEATETVQTPDAAGDCPHCGLALPADGPPMCPRCGAPR